MLPESGIVAPPGSAWLPIRLDVCDFADRRGRLDDRRLEQALDAGVDLGDRLFDGLYWFDDLQRADARDNRRLAIGIAGLGDLLSRRRANPSDFASLRSLDSLLGRIRDRLWARSLVLASRRGALPALAEHSPAVAWRDDAHRHDWQKRWCNALASAQVRHRNLLCLSPYEFFPSGSEPTSDYADLLPLMAHADACCFASPPSLAHWKMNEFKGFYQRLEAQVARHNAAAFVAAGV